MSLHEIKRVSLRDVPGKLRELADHCEREKVRTVIVVIGLDDGAAAVRGYGDRTSALEATGWLHRALDVMTSGAGVQIDTRPKPPDAA